MQHLGICQRCLTEIVSPQQQKISTGSSCILGQKLKWKDLGARIPEGPLPPILFIWLVKICLAFCAQAYRGEPGGNQRYSFFSVVAP